MLTREGVKALVRYQFEHPEAKALDAEAVDEQVTRLNLEAASDYEMAVTCSRIRSEHREIENPRKLTGLVMAELGPRGDGKTVARLLSVP